jgi:hypothetical protein
VEERGAEVVESGGVDLLDCVPGLVDERGGGVPRLNLLSKDCYNAIAVLFEKSLAEVRVIDGLEHLLAERADIVEVYWENEQAEKSTDAVNLQSSSVCTALGCMELEASFCPANLGARAIVSDTISLAKILDSVAIGYV